MPTGYTDPVGKGELTDFSEFALMCSRAMGVAIMQRDESMDVPLRHYETVPDYEFEQVARAKSAYAAAGARTLEEWVEVQERAIGDALRARAESNERMNATVANYRRMLGEVIAWQPPTKEHENFKQFMVNQLEESIKFDGPYPWVLPSPVSAEEYRDLEMAKLGKRVTDAEQRLREAEERVASRNKWVDDFLGSLPNPRVLEDKAGA